MEPEPDMPQKVDLSALDPSGTPRWDRAVTRVAERALELHRLRTAVVRRGAVAIMLAAAAGLALWLSAPRPESPRRDDAILGWAVRDVAPGELLGLGAGDAQ